ncbi:FtsW/RodA/SpoVE family cell cycle protein [Enteractinococcus coprophilus]|uniref:Cell elongation-specific peptidoglycan biosynthesis regulator RodA n=1 Tax=Enteractinococcus coprophilus TaxID=1027633 RepID=A0A543APF8_9MICC|nr:FtsW/RodA/SpoVE family cell cycle protein [Enteractinococcus coprophilus]TQL74439.1 cell elongation-specific peptidoglycan biosynthesis regulator RodA [Enteractinococcus coprophilus]
MTNTIDSVETEQPVKKPLRITEILLMVMAVVIGSGAYMLSGLGMDQTLDAQYWIQLGVMFALAIAFHIVLRLRAPFADQYIMPLALTLNGLGLAMIHRLDLVPPGTNLANNQLLWTALSIIISMAIVWFIIDYRHMRRFTYVWLLASAILLILPFLPFIGVEIYGARIWVNLGIGSFQPGEVAKLTLAIFFASYLSANRDLILLAGRKLGPLAFPRVQDLGPLVVAWLVAMGVLVFQRDLGSAVLFFGLFMAMIYLATSRLSWIILGLVAVGAGGVIAVNLFPHVEARIDGWLNAFDMDMIYAEHGSHQVVQGLFGLASGGLFGSGLGEGRPDLVFAANSDMIIASFGEELGLVGLAAILLIFFILVTRIMRIGLSARDAFGKLLAAGLGCAMAIQMFVVVGGVLRVIPLTGLTTPFMAAGGSSLLANWMIIGLVLLISHTANRPMLAGPMVNASGAGGGAAVPGQPLEAGER